MDEKTKAPPHPLGLKPAEWKAIKDCMWARTQVPNGHFLPAFRRMPAHGRMVERGFLTEVLEPEKGMSPQTQSWRVFKITDENIATYNAALVTAQAEATEKGLSPDDRRV